MRHTFASLHYGKYRDKQLVRNELGHADEAMLRHYVNNGTRIGKQAEEFFSFPPPGLNQDQPDAVPVSA